MPHIDVFVATLSPYCYLAGQRLEAIAARHGASVAYRPVDPLALFARTGGQAHKDRHESRKDYRAQDLPRLAARLGMALNPRPLFAQTNPAPAAYAIIAAQAAVGKGATGDLGGLVHAILRACWAEDRDIADDAVLRDILGRQGFDPRLTDSGLLLGAETYAANLEDAVARGVFGVPFYITDTGQRFWGQDRLEDLDLHLGGKI